MSFRLDSARNRLLKVDVLATMCAALFGIGSFVGSMFGMNLQTPWFVDDEYADGSSFNAVCLGCIFFILISLVLIVRYFIGGCWARTPFNEPDLLDLPPRTSGMGGAPEALGSRRDLASNSM